MKSRNIEDEKEFLFELGINFMASPKWNWISCETYVTHVEYIIPNIIFSIFSLFLFSDL